MAANPASYATGPADWEGSISERDRSDDGTTFNRGVTRKTKKRKEESVTNEKVL